MPNNETYSIRDKELIPRLKATVGHSSKNLLEITEETQTINGVTFTVDKQAGTVTATRESASSSDAILAIEIPDEVKGQNLYFSGCPSKGSTSTYNVYALDYTANSRATQWDGTTLSVTDYGTSNNEVRFVEGHRAQIRLRIKAEYDAQNIVFKPMLRDGSITDDTFEPYQIPTDERIASLESRAATSAEVEARLEATVGHSSKNLLDIDGLDDTLYNVHGYCENGYIRLVGTYQSDTVHQFFRIYFKLPAGSYILSGAPDYSTTPIRIAMCTYASSQGDYTTIGYDQGNNLSFTLNEDSNCFIAFRFQSAIIGVPIDLTLPVMIRSGSISDDTFEPYTMPTDMLIDTKARAYLNSSVGHSCKNLLKITGNTQTVYGVKFVTDATAGTITAYNESTSTSQNNSQYNFRGDSRELIERSFLKDGLIFSCEGLVAYTLCGIAYYNDSNTFISEQKLTASAPSQVISIPSGATKFRFYVRKRMEVGSATVVFKPMLRDGSISDDTFEPYVTPTDERIVSLKAQTEAEIEARLEATVGHSGKNQLSYGSQNLTRTVAGVTFTVDLTAGTVTANGTTTSSSGSQYGILLTGDKYTRVLNYPDRSIPNGKYYFCGCPAGGSTDNASYNVYIYDLNSGTRAKRWDGTTNVATDYGAENKNELLINDQSHSLVFNCRVYDTNGQNIIFRPMVWSGDIPDDSFEPYVTPTDERIVSLEAQAATSAEIEARLRATVGHSSKNLLDMNKHNAYPSGMTVSELDADTGSIVATATGSLRAINYPNTSLGLEPNDGASYIVSLNNNKVNTIGRLTIRSRGDNRVRYQVSLNTVGKKELEFTVDPERFPSGWYISLLVTGSASETASIDVSGLMLREASISDGTFEPYQVPTDERIEPMIYSPINHNGIYRGKDLTNVYTINEIHNRVQNGSFDDLYLGDYFTVSITTDLYTKFSGSFVSGTTYYERSGTINNWVYVVTTDTEEQSGKTYYTKDVVTENVDLMIASFNYYLNLGTPKFTTPHIVLMPKAPFQTTTTMYQDLDSTAYYYTDMHQTTLPCYAVSLNTALQSHVLTHTVMLPTAIDQSILSRYGSGSIGASAGYGWKSTQLQLLNDVQLCGYTLISSSIFDVGCDNQQLHIFRFINYTQFSRTDFWLRSFTNVSEAGGADRYGYVAGNGMISTAYASTVASHVCPLIVFG